MKQLYEFGDALADWWVRIRPPKIQSSSALVILVGTAMLLMSFNDVLFSLLLKPVGFSRDGCLAPIIGTLLAFMGLSALVIDRVVSNSKSPRQQQDFALFGAIVEQVSWDDLDQFLDHVNADWYWSQESDKFANILTFGQDDLNQFTDGSMKRRWSHFLSDLRGLMRFAAVHFFYVGDDMSRLRFLEPNDYHRDENVRLRHNEHRRELRAHIEATEASYRSLISRGRELGMVSRDQN